MFLVISLRWYSPQLFSSEPSGQSFSPLQNRPRSTHMLSPQAKNPSWHSGSSVQSSGFTLRSLLFRWQFLTASFQSHVCFSMSKYRPAGQRIACRPCEFKEIRQRMQLVFIVNKIQFYVSFFLIVDLTIIQQQLQNNEMIIHLRKMYTGSHHGNCHCCRPPNGTIRRHPYLCTAPVRRTPPSFRRPQWWPVASIGWRNRLEQIIYSSISRCLNYKCSFIWYLSCFLSNLCAFLMAFK